MLLALLPSLLFGAMGLVLGAWPTDQRRQNLWTLIGAAAISVAAAPVVGGVWSVKATLLGVLSGLMWSCGQILVLRGFAAWGVSRTMPVTTALQLVLNGVIGIIAFGEWRAPGAMPLGLTALGLVILGAVACSWNEGTGAGPTAAQRRTGLTVTIGSAFMYGLYPSILKGAGVSTPDALAPMGIGLLLGAALCAAILPHREPLTGPRSAQAALAGGLWAIGNALLLRSTSTISVATGFTLSQLGFVLTTLGGMWLLGETRTRKETAVTVVGVVAAVIGVVLLGTASSR